MFPDICFAENVPYPQRFGRARHPENRRYRLDALVRDRGPRTAILMPERTLTRFRGQLGDVGHRRIGPFYFWCDWRFVIGRLLFGGIRMSRPGRRSRVVMIFRRGLVLRCLWSPSM